MFYYVVANILKLTKSSTENHFQQISYVSHFEMWLPHLENVSFLKQIMSYDKNGYFKAMWNAIDCDTSESNHICQYQSSVFL